MTWYLSVREHNIRYKTVIPLSLFLTFNFDGYQTWPSAAAVYLNNWYGKRLACKRELVCWKLYLLSQNGSLGGRKNRCPRKRHYEWHIMSCKQLALLISNYFTHWGRHKWPPFSRRHFQIQFLEWKLKFHCSLFPRVKLTIFQHWFR